MIETAVLVVALVMLAALAFAASVRLGMLVGLRLDRFMIERAASDGPAGIEAKGLAHSSASPKKIDADSGGPQEDRGD